MKDSFLLPVVFLGFLIACFVLLTLGYLMFLWDTNYLASAPPTVAWALARAPGAMKTILLPAVIIALFLVIARTARKPGVPILSFLFSLIVASAALYFGLTQLDRFPGAASAIAVRTYDPLAPGHFNLLQQGVIYPTQVSGNSLGPTVVVNPLATSPKPALALEPSGTFEPRTWTARFPNRSASITIQPRNPTLSEELAPRSFLVTLFGDMNRMNAFLDRARRSSRLDFSIALGGIVLFSTSCMGFAWITRWPLMNLFLVGVCFRAVFWLFSFFSTPAAAGAFALLLPVRYRPLAPSLGLAALAVIVLVWDLIFVRAPARD